MNRIIENNYKSAEPTVGMGATELLYTDRHAYTIIEVSKGGKSAIIQRDKAIRTDTGGMTDAQGYRYESNPQGATYTIKLYKDGHWHIYIKGSGKGNVVMLGNRREYYDYSF